MIDISKLYNMIKDIPHPNSRKKILMEEISEEDMMEFGTTELKQIDYCIMNKLKHVPLAPCGENKKYHNGKYLNVCEKYKLGDNHSCIVCHENKTKETLSKMKKTSLSKYQTEFPNQSIEVKRKIRENSNFTEDEKNAINEKKKETSLKQFGTEHPMKNSTVKLTQIQSRKKTQEQTNNKRIKTLMQKKTLIVSENLDKSKYEIVELRLGTNVKSTFRCLQCGQQFDALSHWGCKVVYCPQCDVSPMRSNMENDVVSIIKEIEPTIDIELNNRKIIKPKEIDIYLPKYNLGIEVNGMYWHSDKFKSENYHQDKVKAAMSSGMKLLTIYDYDLSKNKDVIVSMIKNSMNKSSFNVYARKCEIKEVPKVEERNFLNTYHIQGFVGSNICYGLYYNCELVSLMSFGKPRFNKSFEYEIIRFCSKGNVVGAAGKLLKHFERTIKPKSLMTYADLRYGYGKTYEKIGFEYKYITKPGYFYVNGKGDVVTRYQAQKHKLLKKYPEYQNETNITEYDIMGSEGYLKIYDCGNAVYVKEYNNE